MNRHRSAMAKTCAARLGKPSNSTLVCHALNVEENKFDVQDMTRYNAYISGSKAGHGMENSKNDAKNAGQNKGGEVAYRSGVAARLAGLSVETLRVWERRYGVSETERSPRGQRLYSEEQVYRLRLLKNLVDQGHPIGAIAGLPVAQLQELNGANAQDPDKPAGPIRVAVVGESLEGRLAGGGRESLNLDNRCSCPNLEQALSRLPKADAEVLVIELSELDESAVPHIIAAREAAEASAVVVLYRFCASATIRLLRSKDCFVMRVPADLGELVWLCRAALAGQRYAIKDQTAEQPTPPRFDEDALTFLSTSANKVGCECPRHLADILLMVGSFERYSAQCESRNPEDAQLHRELGHAAGQARSVLETAMERLVQAEGIKY